MRIRSEEKLLREQFGSEYRRLRAASAGVYSAQAPLTISQFSALGSARGPRAGVGGSPTRTLAFTRPFRRAAESPSRTSVAGEPPALPGHTCQPANARAMYPLLMPRLPKQNYHDIERIIEFDFVRATEAAALNSLQWLGRGEKEAADAAACDAIRGMFDLMNICGEVVIGEGIKDDAPGIFKGEQLGTWLPGTPQFDIAIDPIDGTTNISKGAPNSISCIAAASPEEGVKVALRDIPSFYMTKLSYGPRVIQHMQTAGAIRLKMEAPDSRKHWPSSRARLNKRVQDVVVMMLDRPRHKEIVDGNSGRGRFACA